MVDGLTQWLNLLTKQYRETSTVLCNERYYMKHKIQQVNTAQAHNTDLHKQALCLTCPPGCQCPTEDQLSQDSERLTLETCLDELDAEDSTTNMLVWSAAFLSHWLDSGY